MPSPVLIDAAWLSSHGPAPYPLGQAGTTYTLATDVRTDGTAFVFTAANVTLDLAGHTITYNDGDPTPVPSGDFSDWPGSWDMSGAAASTFDLTDSAPLWMPGDKSLHWSIPANASAQSILSAPITLPDIHTFTASVCSRDAASAKGFLVRVEIIDAGTLAHVAKWRRFEGNLGGAEGGVCSFLPDRAGQVVRMRVTLVSSAAGTDGIIGRAALTRSLDYGVVATPVYRTQFYGCPFTSAQADSSALVNGSSNLSAATKTAYIAGGTAPTIVDSVGGGAIIQGRAGGAYCHAIMAPSCTGAAHVEGVECRVSGDDTSGIIISGDNVATFAPGDSRTVRDCSIISPPAGAHITTRQGIVAAIEAAGGGPSLVEGCTITDNPHVGIKLGTLAPGALATVSDNTLAPNTVITNGYALMIRGNHARVLDNRVVATKSSRGVHVEGTLEDIEIAGNLVDVRERGNREYDQQAGCRAIAIRNLGPTNPARNVSVHDNTFIARTGPGLQYQADAGRFVFNNINVDGANILIRDNTFRGIVEGTTDPGRAYRATGLIVDSCAVNVRPRWERCRMEGTDVAVQISGPNAGTQDATSDLTFSGCTLARPAEGLKSRPFSGWQVGYNNGPVTRITLLDTSYEAGATPAILWGGGPGARDVGVGYTLSVQARDGQGVAVPGALVSLADVTGSADTYTTDSAGNRDVPGIVTRYSRAAGTVIAPPTASTRTPLRLTVSRSDLPDTFSQTYASLTSSLIVPAVLGGAGGGPEPPLPPLPPPPSPPPETGDYLILLTTAGLLIRRRSA